MEHKTVKSTLEQFKKYYDRDHEANVETRKANADDLANKYFDLVTSLVEYGWGESFHFANRYKGETFRESIKRYEHFLALQLGLKPGMKVLDVGCGIGGPLREIARFSLTSITGLNNNEYQISRAKELNLLAGLSESCNLVKGNFMNMPFPDNTFDAIYAIEATCYASDQVACYKEICRVLKPGQCFACYEMCMSNHFNPRNEEHQKIKGDLEFFCGVPDLRTTSQNLEALKLAGFEVVWERDRVLDSPVPWYLSLDPGRFSISNFRATAIGIWITKSLYTRICGTCSSRKCQNRLIPRKGWQSIRGSWKERDFYTNVLLPCPKASSKILKSKRQNSSWGLSEVCQPWLSLMIVGIVYNYICMYLS